MTTLISRRAALAGGTVAAALVARKSAATELGDLSDLKLVQPPTPAPIVVFQDADGNPHKLTDYVGFGLVINLWATWCAPCTAELPSLDKLAGKMTDKRIKVLAISSDHGGATVVQAFYKQHDIKNLQVLVDPNGEAVHAFNARGIPTTFIIDRRGMERAYAEGSENWATEAAAKRVEELVAL